MLLRLKTVFETDLAAIVWKGLLGVSAVGSSVAISLAPVVQGLQVISLTLGIAIAAATLISIYEKGSGTVRKVLTFSILLAALAAVCLMFTGCLNYNPSREIAIINADGSSYHSKESAPLRTLFKRGEAALVSVETRDDISTGKYSRKVNAAKIKTAGDPESIDATGNAAGNTAKTFIAR
jgi:hypothetical protein